MATQPAPRPFEKVSDDLFRYGQSARPLVDGVVHRNQRLDDNPLVAFLTPEGRKAQGDIKPSGDASFDKNSVVPQPGAPVKQEYFVSEIPFQVTEADLKRGQTLYNSNCALCHGAAGWGDGKIAERGFLRPPSYHTDPTAANPVNEGKRDWSTWDQPSVAVDDKGKPKADTGLPMGYSRGFYRWGVKVPLKDVPIGYIVQVISWGFGGMASHETQLPDWADRWRVAAYLRALQISQGGVPVADLPAAAREALANGKPAAKTHGGEH